MTYSLYIDESGDPGRYTKRHDPFKDSSKYFVLGGIIVENGDIERMEKSVRDIIDNYFTNREIDKPAKLHYSQMVQNRPPYDKLSGEDKRNLADDVFNIISAHPCVLLSVALDLENHYGKYIQPFNPKAYTLLVMMERFQLFLSGKQSMGIAFYEEFHYKERVNIQNIMLASQRMLSPIRHVSLNNIHENIKDGDPIKQPILQLADFFAYATHVNYRTDRTKRTRWNYVKRKHFKFEGSYYTRGNVLL